MPRDTIRFLRAGKLVEIGNVAGETTLLDYLRESEGAKGTKEGCNEGDCGACTVALGRLEDGRLRYRPVNACITLLGMVDGADVVVVDDLKAANGGDLHPVQEAMVKAHGSQCGFCTPGFVMSLFTLYQEGPVKTRDAVTEALAGNLCRCTGYRPIVEAGLSACAGKASDAHARQAARTGAALARIDNDHDLFIGDEDRFFAAPGTLASLAMLYDRYRDACIVAGATDVGLWVTKQLRELDRIIWIGRVRELQQISVDGSGIEFGAGVSYARAFETLDAFDDDLGELLRRLGSKQVRAAGTLCGNIANGSPIGDMPPALIALEARLRLRRGSMTRELPLEDFFIDYGRQDLAPGEFVEAVIVPYLQSDQAFRCYKVSKRFDQDISAVMGAFRLSVAKGKIAGARIAYGGMAATPKRALAAERALVGASLASRDGWQAGVDALERDFAPISDMRASATYRMATARALLDKALMEIAGTPSNLTRVVGARKEARGGRAA